LAYFGFISYSAGDPFDHGSSVEERNPADTEPEETMTDVKLKTT